MSTLAARCGVHDDARAAASERVLQRLRDEGVSQVRIAWGDLHGLWRGKTLMVGLADFLILAIDPVSI